MKTLWILRGIPHTGKTDFARKLADGRDVICSASAYFDGVPARYRDWTPDARKEAHGMCFTKAKSLVEGGSDIVIIDNINSRIEEMMPYYEMAVANGYDVIVRETDTQIWRDMVVPYIKDKKAHKKELRAAADALAKVGGNRIIPSELYRIIMKYHAFVSVAQMRRRLESKGAMK